MELHADFKLGVLGGGQLGRMLIQAAMNYNVDVWIIDPDPNAPCKDLATHFEVGKLTDFDTVCLFGKSVDLLTIEIENVNAEALKKLEEEGLPVFPQPDIIRLIQDKGEQKQFYQKHNIPTASFQLVENKEEITADFPFIQKLRKEGYDGRGVKKINSEIDLKDAFEKPSLVEELIDFEKELSVIVARNADGGTKAFPVVELEFHPEQNLVEYLFSPANISKEIEQKAEDLAVDVAGKLGIVGLLAVEMFLTRDGKVLVNEIAPRTHNSGHQSIEGNITSQFEQHLRAILNLPLGDTSIKIPSVMVNLLGELGYEGEAKYKGLEEVLALDGVSIHLYGKKLTRPFRKMGHVTITDRDLGRAKEKAKFVKNTLKVIA